MGKVAFILKEHRKDLAAFSKWFVYINENKIKKIDIAKAIDNISQINVLTQQKKNLEKEIQTIQEDKIYYLTDLENIKKEYYKKELFPF